MEQNAAFSILLHPWISSQYQNYTRLRVKGVYLSTTTDMLNLGQLSNGVVVFGTAPLLTFEYCYPSCIKLIKLPF